MQHSLKLGSDYRRIQNLTNIKIRLHHTHKDKLRDNLLFNPKYAHTTRSNNDGASHNTSFIMPS